jgi:dTMP kinase
VEATELLVLVVIDGLDASGKSTQGMSLYARVRARGKSACLRIHPSEDNFFGVKTKEFLYSRGKSAHLAAAFFYMLDVLRSILNYSWRKYDYVIFVRYLMGTSYLPSPLFTFAYDFFASIVPMSDYMFFLDVTPKEAYRRVLQTRRRQEMFESLEELELIRRRALSLALRGKWTIIDADRSIGEIEKEILKSLSRQVCQNRGTMLRG